jgi:uncharacterized membrane protein
MSGFAAVPRGMSTLPSEYALPMPTDPKRTLRAAVRAAQERYEEEVEAARQARRDAFTRAQDEGLSLSEIAAEVGLHRSRIGQIIEGK